MAGAFPAAAQTEQGSTADGEIIVTARRSEERLQDVPVSISVYSQEQLQNRNIFSPSDLAAYTPSLTANSRFGSEKTTFVIRGFGQEVGTAPSVGVYFADVVAPRGNGPTISGNGGGVGQLFDLQNVQVLKGPQGTLFGRNTTGGAILLVPHKPEESFGGYAEATVGNYDLRRLQGILNVPVADTVRIRAGVDWQQRDGYLKNRSGVGPSRQGDVNYIAARFSIVADLTPTLENYTIGSYSYSNTDAFSPKVTVCDRNLAATPGGFLAALGCAQVDRQKARGDGFWDIENSVSDPFARLRQWQIINTTTWEASDTLTVKNIISYAEYRESQRSDNNGTNYFLAPGVDLPLVIAQSGANPYSSSLSTFTEELQVQGGTADDNFSWQTGAYLEVSKPVGDSENLYQVLLPCNDIAARQCIDVLSPGESVTVGSLADTVKRESFNNKGFYAQGTYKLSDQFSVTGGIRYTIDKRRISSSSVAIVFPTPFVAQMRCGDVTRFNSDPATLAPIVVTSIDQCNSKFSIKSEKPTWVVGLDYRPNEDILFYGKWSRGYRAGGILAQNFGIETWGPETLDTYEIGSKTSFHGALNGFLNLAAFYNDFRDQQIAASALPQPQYLGLGGSQAIINAGKSRIWGIEADASLRPVAGLRIDVGYAYLNTKLQQIDTPVAPPIFLPLIPQATVGGPLAFSPKHRLTASADYTLPTPGDIGDITVGASYTYTSANAATAPAASPEYLVPATNLVTLNASWKAMFGSPVDVSLFVTNLTNEKYLVAPLGVFPFLGVDGGTPNQPRMIGARLRYNFGR
jgi:iron complex outermembrane receptor protein